MIYNKNNFQIADLAPKEGGYYQDGVHVTNDYTEVTNGHYVVRVSTPKDGKKLVEEFPFGIGKKPVELEKNGCIISSKFAKAVSDAIPKKPTLPVLENTVTVESAKDDIEFAVTDLDVTRFLRGRKVDSKFPDIDAAIPKQNSEHVVSVNPDYLIKILQQFKKMKIETVRFDFYDENQPIKITGKDDKEQECFALLMQMKTEY